MSPIGRAALVIAGSTLLAGAAAHDYADGPPPAHTGGFGEPTCHFCHADYPLNEGGTLEVQGVPATFTPGASYALRVVLRHPELRRAGFQLSARFTSGAQAGTLRMADGDGAVVTEGDVAYAQHVRSSSDVATAGSRVWRVTWIAPPYAAGDVVFHVAANAANDDASEFGDRIHTTEVTTHAPTK